MPSEMAFFSVNPISGTWHVAHEIVLSAESRLSKNSQRPNRTRSGVGGSEISLHLWSIPSGGSGKGATGFAVSHAGTARSSFGGVARHPAKVTAAAMTAIAKREFKLVFIVNIKIPASPHMCRTP